MMMLISLIPVVQVKAVIGHAANEVSMELSERAYDTERFLKKRENGGIRRIGAGN